MNDRFAKLKLQYEIRQLEEKLKSDLDPKDYPSYKFASKVREDIENELAKLKLQLLLLGGPDEYNWQETFTITGKPLKEWCSKIV